MAYRFNPAPGWPQPPTGWLPPAGWRPDPSWPPAPHGWQWLVEDDTEPTIALPGYGTPPTPVSVAGGSWVSRHKVLTGVITAVAALLVIGTIGNAMDTGDPAPHGIAVAATSTPTATPEGEASSSAPSTPEAAATTAEVVEDRVTMPKLVGLRLSAAEAVLSSLGIDNVDARDASPEDRIVLLSTNWVVTAQGHKPGSKIDPSESVILKVKKPSDGQGTVQTAVGTVPDVTCMDLQAAQDTLQAAGFFNLGSEDGSGQGRMQILDRDWVVIAQSVPAGAQPSPLKRIVLASVKYGESTGASNCRS
jgi:hypothetical protein